MSTSDLFQPLSLTRGPAWPNRLMLAPLTNQQSLADGRLSDDEYRWLTMRAEGGFGMTMTCAALVQAVGQAFPGQLGVFSDTHLDGLHRLAQGIRANGSISSLQLHHGGNRGLRDIVGQPVSASDDPEKQVRGLTLEEVVQLKADFVAAALRSEAAGFDGVEVHGAHGYLLTQFLSTQTNRRTDRYGGSLENRCRLLLEIVGEIRARCRPDFQIGLRLSPERFGLRLPEMRELAAEVLQQGEIDYLDLSLWDVFGDAIDEIQRDRPLMRHFTDLPRGKVRVGVAGKIMSASDALRVLDAGCDFAIIGRAAILRHDFPKRVLQDADYRSPALPVSASHLANEGLGPVFIDYLRTWDGFVSA